MTDTEPGSALPWKKILSQARRTYLEKEGQACRATLRDRMLAFSTKTTVIGICTRVHHPLTKVVTIWRTWQRRRRSRRGLTQRYWEVRESDNSDAIAMTEQRPKTTFRPDVQVEPPEEVPDNSEFIASVDTVRRKTHSESIPPTRKIEFESCK